MFHHDEFPDKLVHISDASFFEALDPDRHGLEEVRSAADSRRYDEAFGAWWRHFLSRSHPVNPFARSEEQLRSRVVANRDLADTSSTGGGGSSDRSKSTSPVRSRSTPGSATSPNTASITSAGWIA